jgi:hypothetical protein
MHPTRIRALSASELDDAVWSSPTALFSLLERARDRSDYELAARAQRRLLDLGVAVLFRPRQGREVRDARP